MSGPTTSTSVSRPSRSASSRTHPRRPTSANGRPGGTTGTSRLIRRLPHPGLSPAAITGGVLIVCVAISRVLADAPLLPAIALLTAGAVIVALALRNPRWEVPLHALAAALLGILAGWAASRIWWLAPVAVGVIAATLWLARMVSGDRLREAEDKAERLAAQVDRRISELFSLRELSY